MNNIEWNRNWRRLHNVVNDDGTSKLPLYISIILKATIKRQTPLKYNFNYLNSLKRVTYQSDQHIKQDDDGENQPQSEKSRTDGRFCIALGFKAVQLN